MSFMPLRLIGASAFVTASMLASQTARADDYSATIDAYRIYCQEPSYRQRYADYCARYGQIDDSDDAGYEGDDDGYYPSDYYPYYSDGGVAIYYDNGHRHWHGGHWGHGGYNGGWGNGGHGGGGWGNGGGSSGHVGWGGGGGGHGGGGHGGHR